MIFSKDKTKESQDETPSVDETQLKNQGETPEKKVQAASSNKEKVSLLCDERNLSPWIKAGMMALKQWNDDTQVTHQEFVDGLEEFNTRPQGG